MNGNDLVETQGNQYDNSNEKTTKKRLIKKIHRKRSLRNFVETIRTNNNNNNILLESIVIFRRWAE